MENCNLADEYCFEDILEFLINSQFESVPIILYDDGIFLNSLIVSKDFLENDFVESYWIGILEYLLMVILCLLRKSINYLIRVIHIVLEKF